MEALIVDREKPTKALYPHIKIEDIKNFIIIPFLPFPNKENRADTNAKIKLICSPETAIKCIVPAFENDSLVSLLIWDLSPTVSDTRIPLS
ncbi:hypothetical protein SDC9_140853 [bioreactor metagenome]|uniref:Uncharacterized protein n=1 Tax=bioreactor metagenome TaxID=1076179 RepID=A0A645DWL7_9ZZZZ